MEKLTERIKQIAVNIIESNITLILNDLDKAQKDRFDDGYETASIKPQISLNICKYSDTHYSISPSIKWERKNIKADSMDTVDIDLQQPELFDAEVVEVVHKANEENSKTQKFLNDPDNEADTGVKQLAEAVGSDI